MPNTPRESDLYLRIRHYPYWNFLFHTRYWNEVSTVLISGVRMADACRRHTGGHLMLQVRSKVIFAPYVCTSMLQKDMNCYAKLYWGVGDCSAFVCFAWHCTLARYACLDVPLTLHLPHHHSTFYRSKPWSSLTTSHH